MTPRTRLPSFVAFLLASASVCLANVSLVIPDFDPQPLSAEIVGVGADNQTTYLLFPGQPTGTWVSQPPAFSGTATLVEGASNVVFEYANSALTVMESCVFANGIADCNVAVGGGTTGTAQDTVTPLLVQGGATAVSSATTGVPTTTGTVAPGSSVPASSATQTGTVSSSASPTQTANSGVRTLPGMVFVGGMVALSAVLVLV